MSSPQDQERERDPHGVPAQDAAPGEPAETDVRKDRRYHHEPELEQEKRERRADDQGGLSLRRMRDANGDYPVRQAQHVVQGGEARHAPEDEKRAKRLPHDGVDQRDPHPNTGANDRAEDHALAERAVMPQRHAQSPDATRTATITTAVTRSDRVTPAYSLRSAAFLLSPTRRPARWRGPGPARPPCWSRRRRSARSARCDPRPPQTAAPGPGSPTGCECARGWTAARGLRRGADPGASPSGAPPAPPCAAPCAPPCLALRARARSLRSSPWSSPLSACGSAL